MTGRPRAAVAAFFSVMLAFCVGVPAVAEEAPAEAAPVEASEQSVEDSQQVLGAEGETPSEEGDKVDEVVETSTATEIPDSTAEPTAPQVDAEDDADLIESHSEEQDVVPAAVKGTAAGAGASAGTDVTAASVATAAGDAASTAKAEDKAKDKAEDKAEATAENVYRVYNPYTGQHHHTLSLEEAEADVKAGWIWEGAGWTEPTSKEGQGKAVYRAYNPYNGDHHYTTDANELKKIVAAGWKDEGTAWYEAKEGGVKVYRLYNPYAKVGYHHYTVSTTERAALLKAGWKDEGTGWIALSAQPIPSEHGRWLEGASGLQWVQADQSAATNRYVSAKETAQDSSRKAVAVYADTSGVVVRGAKKVGERTIVANRTTGELPTATGIYKTSAFAGKEKTYYLVADKAGFSYAKTGEVTVDGKTYYFGVDGASIDVGLHKVNGHWVYYKANGTEYREEFKKFYYGTNAVPADATVLQARLVKAANATRSPGRGLCAAWITYVFQNAGIGGWAGNACDMYWRWCKSADPKALKAGMIIAVNTEPLSRAGRIYGHVGVYVGNGIVRQNVDGQVKYQTLPGWIRTFGGTTTVKWGWLGGKALE